MRITSSLVAILVIVQHSALVGQTFPSVGALNITVQKGEGGRNSIKTRSGTPIEIEVRDPGGKPVAGAQVIVQLPNYGASGSFPGGQLTKRTVTGPNGQAIVTGFVPNDIPGRFSVKITADSGTLSGSIVVSQVNVAELASEAKKSRKTLWILLAAAGGGGAILAGSMAGGKTTTTAAPTVIPSVTLVPGTVSVGGPR